MKENFNLNNLIVKNTTFFDPNTYEYIPFLNDSLGKEEFLDLDLFYESETKNSNIVDNILANIPEDILKDFFDDELDIFTED